MKRKTIATLSALSVLVVLSVTISAFHRPQDGLSFVDRERLISAAKKLVPDKHLVAYVQHVEPSGEPRVRIVCGLIVSKILRLPQFTPLRMAGVDRSPNAVYWVLYDTRLGEVRDLAISGVNMGFEEFGDRCLKY